MTAGSLARLRELVPPLQVKPGTRVTLPHGHDPGHTSRFVTEAQAADSLHAGIELLAEYQARLAAQDTYALLVVLQALDAAGKDGTIKHVMSGVNPQGVRVHSFGVPSREELNHDYLWRYARSLPERGAIGIFNRSHYEEVLVVRVHADKLEQERLPAETRSGDLWRRRFEEINGWERYLHDNGVRVVKIFLNVSREEQRRRLLARLDDPHKSWKFSANDLVERRAWDAYQDAYSAVLSHTSTEWAPWYVIPADHKWFARVAAAAVIVDALARIDPRYPLPKAGAADELDRARAELEAGG